MDSDLIIVKVLINRIFFKPVLINTGCEYYFREGLFILRLWLFILRQSGAVWLRCGW